MPYRVRDAVGGYNSITDEFFIFGGWDYSVNGSLNAGYKYSYMNGTWNGIHFNQSITRSLSQYYTQHNNVIYYYNGINTNKINTFNMTYPYSQTLTIDANGLTIYDSPCLSVDKYGNLYLSSSGFALFNHDLHYYGYSINDSIWQTFTHSTYWDKYNYDMRYLACIVHNEILYTFGGFAGSKDRLSQYYGSNMISYHNISDFNKPFLSKGFSRWNKVSQNLTQFGRSFRVVSVHELIYIIGGYSDNPIINGSCCVGEFNDVQIFDPRTHTIKGKIDGIEPLPQALWSTTCHFRSISNTINCFGGALKYEVENNWIYSNPLLTDSPSDSPSQSPSNSPTDSPTVTPSQLPSQSPSNIPSNIPTNTPIKSNKSILYDRMRNKTIIIIITTIFSTLLILCGILLFFVIKRYYTLKTETDSDVDSPKSPMKSNDSIKNIYINNAVLTPDNSDKLIAKEYQENQFDLKNLTSGNIPANEFITKGQNHTNINGGERYDTEYL